MMTLETLATHRILETLTGEPGRHFFGTEPPCSGT